MNGILPSFLSRDWSGEGIELGQVAVELLTGEGGSPTVLDQSYYVPSFEFAATFGLRQLPGTLDLVDPRWSLPRRPSGPRNPGSDSCYFFVATWSSISPSITGSCRLLGASVRYPSTTARCPLG